MCLTETCSRVRVGKNLSDIFPIRNGLKLTAYIQNLGGNRTHNPRKGAAVEPPLTPPSHRDRLHTSLNFSHSVAKCQPGTTMSCTKGMRGQTT